MDFKRINNIVGWVVFTIAITVYLLTMEKTSSFWDCGEFIAASNKLQVVHPPGAPNYLMLGRLFSMFLPADQVAFGVNFLSALSSAFAALFVFWSTTIMAKRMLLKEATTLTKGKIWAVIGSGVVAGLAFVFQDTQWFNSVEAEVYAVSTMLTALVFWMALKWSEHAQEQGADRWLIAIAYVIGLSLGVHLLNLLAIPAIALLVYFKRSKEISIKGGIIAFIVGFVTLIFVQYGIILELPKLGSKLELTFVNDFGLPFGSGIFFLIFLLFGAVVSLILYAIKQKTIFLHVALGIIGVLAVSQFLKSYSPVSSFVKFLLIGIVAALIYWKKGSRQNIYKGALAMGFIMIGYLSYIMVPIRSNANPPIDINNPDNVFNLLSYLNREQYGQKPLLYGPMFDAQPTGTEKIGDVYAKRDKKYEKIDDKIKYQFNKEDQMLFPRAWQFYEDSKGVFYRNWLNLGATGKPTPAHNIKWLYTYQLDFMYWRYFMWNFGGRQNDIQGHGMDLSTGNREFSKGQWESGIPFVDRDRAVRADLYPDNLSKNKGKNHYFLIPFVIGLFGLVLQFKYSRNDGFVLTALFIMTGLAIVIFLNQDPIQPRERDYAYAGSFLAFGMWIGLAVAGLFRLSEEEDWKDIVNNLLWVMVPLCAMVVMGFGSNTSVNLIGIVLTVIILSAIVYAIAMLLKKVPLSTRGIAFTALCLLVPALMGMQGWDDHNRHQHRLARDTGANYLLSTAQDAILFTEGDNDTYPVWYAQEVEKVRPDVRIVNNSLLKGDWYMDQVKQHNGNQPGLKSTYISSDYEGSKREVVYYDAKYDTISLKLLSDYIKSDDPRTMIPTKNLGKVDAFPAKNFFLNVDANAQVKNGLVDPSEANKIVPVMNFRLGKNNLVRDEIMMYDIIQKYINERPIYFTGANLPKVLGLSKYIRQEGSSYRLLPIEDPNFGTERYSPNDPTVDPDITYDLLMNTLGYGNMESGTALTETGTRQVYRMMDFTAKAMLGLAAKGEKEKVLELYKIIREKYLQSDMEMDDTFALITSTDVIDALYEVEAIEEANAFSEEVADGAIRQFIFANTADLSVDNQGAVLNNMRVIVSNLMRAAVRNDQTDLFDKLDEKAKIMPR